MMYCADRMSKIKSNLDITSLQEFRRYMEYIDEDLSKTINILVVVQNTND